MGECVEGKMWRTCLAQMCFLSRSPGSHKRAMSCSWLLGMAVSGIGKEAPFRVAQNIQDHGFHQTSDQILSVDSKLPKVRN